MILYHGTSEENAKMIMKEGFTSGKSYNWEVRSKSGFIYLSLAYAPFYAMTTKLNKNKLALIKVEVDENELYPDDDFLMLCLGKQIYTQKDLDNVNIEMYKRLWKESLKFLGNISVKTDKVKILGVRFFDGKELIMVCDPLIAPINFKIMGKYYIKLTEFIFNGGNIKEFCKSPDEMTKLMI